MKKIILLCIIFITSNLMHAQKKEFEPLAKHVIKLNAYSLFFKTASLQYEHTLGKKTSIAIGARYSPQRNVLGNSLFSNVPSTFGGFAVTPEFRYYFTHNTGRGIYLAPFTRIEYFNEKIKIDSAGFNTLNYRNYYGGLGAGILLGCQFVPAHNVSIDWWILGLYGKRYASHITKFTKNGIQQSEAIIEQEEAQTNASLRNSLPNVLEFFLGTNPAISAYYPRARFGLTVGYRF